MDASYKIQRGIHVHLIQFFMCPEFWVHIKRNLRFLRHVAGCAFWQAIRVWPHSEIFAGRRARKNACWGAPQTRCTSGQIVPKSRCAAP